MFEDVLEHREIVGIQIFTCQEGHNEYGLFPFGMEAELGTQVFLVLPEDVERGDAMDFLGEVRNGFALSVYESSAADIKRFLYGIRYPAFIHKWQFDHGSS